MPKPRRGSLSVLCGSLSIQIQSPAFAAPRPRRVCRQKASQSFAPRTARKKSEIMLSGGGLRPDRTAVSGFTAYGCRVPLAGKNTARLASVSFLRAAQKLARSRGASYFKNVKTFLKNRAAHQPLRLMSGSYRSRGESGRRSKFIVWCCLISEGPLRADICPEASGAVLRQPASAQGSEAGSCRYRARSRSTERSWSCRKIRPASILPRALHP